MRFPVNPPFPPISACHISSSTHNSAILRISFSFILDVTQEATHLMALVLVGSIGSVIVAVDAPCLVHVVAVECLMEREQVHSSFATWQQC